MERGENGLDISNDIPQRIIFLWESTLGSPRDPDKERIYLRVHRWRKAVDCWEISPFAVGRIWDIYRRHNLRCDLTVTTRPSEFAVALAERLNAENVPIRQVVAMDAAVLARKLAYMPDVVYVVFGDQKQWCSFGSKGLYMAHDGRTTVL